MAEFEATITDTDTGAKIPVEGIGVTGSPGNPAPGLILRQTVAIGDGADSQTFARVETSAPSTTDPALIVRGLMQMEDLCLSLVKVLEFVESPIFIESATGRVRVTLDAVAGALTFATITSVGTVGTVTVVTNLSQLGGNDAKASVNWQLDDIAFQQVLGRIT